MIDKYVRYPLHTPLIDISMVLGVHARLRMNCHGYGRMDKVTHEMQPRFIHSLNLSPDFREFCFYFDGGSMARCRFIEALNNWRRNRAGTK